MANTYWGGKGKHQALYDEVNKLIPDAGEVPEPRKNRALEKMRKAANCYYDLFNNGLCNRATEFRQVFGFGGTSISEGGYRDTDPKALLLEEKMDAIILAAAKEQNVQL